ERAGAVADDLIGVAAQVADEVHGVGRLLDELAAALVLFAPPVAAPARLPADPSSVNLNERVLPRVLARAVDAVAVPVHVAHRREQPRAVDRVCDLRDRPDVVADRLLDEERDPAL